MENKREELISVIIPIYNTEKYIERCVLSIIHNSYKNLEVICVDDGSTDNSLKILKSLKEKDGRIRIIEKENSGVSAARNVGLKEARGEYISFIDSDDWIHKDFFKYLMEKKQDADIVVANYKATSEVKIKDKEILSKDEGKLLKVDDAFWNQQVRMYVWGRIYRKECLENYFQQGISLGEDTLFNVFLFSNSNELIVKMCEEDLYYYYNREDSIMHLSSLEDYLKMVECYLDNLDNLTRKDFAIYECFRILFLYRYMGSVKKVSVKAKANKLLFRCLRYLNREHISLLKKIKYYVATIFPAVYRLNLIAKDRTLLQWERRIRNSDT